MRKHIIIFVLFSIKLFSQDIENIKLRDTVYLSFKHGEEYNYLKSKQEKNKFSDRFLHQFPDSKQLVFFTLPNEKKLKKNRKLINLNKIFTIKSIDKLGYNESLNLFYDKKLIIYLIDNNKCNKQKVVLKRIYIENIKNQVM